MGANVTSLVRPRRKRVRGWAWLSAIAAALATFAAAALLAQMLNRTPSPPPQAAPAETAGVAEAGASLPETDVGLDLAIAVSPRARHRSAHRSGIPLDADGAGEVDGYEILSAAELDAISQARD